MKDFIREKVCFYSPVTKGRFSTFEMLDYAAGRGAKGLELLNFSEELQTPDMAAAKEIGRRAKALGLYLPCLSVGVDFALGEYSEKVELVKRYVDIAAELEIPMLHHTVVFSLTPPEDKVYAAKFGLMGAEEIADYANARGIQTVVEDQGFIYNGVENYTKLLEGTGRKVGFLLDVGNSLFMDEDSNRMLSAFSADVRHVHIKDFAVSDFKPTEGSYYQSISGKYITDCEVGTGAVDFDGIRRGLKAINYDGLYSLEFANVSGEDEVDRVLKRTYEWFGK